MFTFIGQLYPDVFFLCSLFWQATYVVDAFSVRLVDAFSVRLADTVIQ